MERRSHDAARKLLLAGIVLPILLGLVASSYAVAWRLIDGKIRHDFPAVKRITTGELAAWLGDPKRPQPVLLDVRTRAEYDVSHLAEARPVEPAAPASAIDLRKDQPIVTYCSVGYRSGAFAQRLIDAGYTNVANLEGSIFRWANEGRPVTLDGRTVEKVHPYNRTWGLLLDKRYYADVAAADAKP